MAKTIQTKRYSKCKQIKAITDFYKATNCKNGYRNQCKNCIKNYQKSDVCKATQKRYRQSEKSKIYQRTYQKHYRQSTKGKSYKKFFQLHQPEQRKARHCVSNAIKAGKLISPKLLLCYYCPKPAQQYHHWHGYEPEHWLDVVPACRDCNIKQN